MGKQNPAIVVLVLISYLCGGAEASSITDCERRVKEAQLLADDTVAMSIEELKEVTRFAGKLVNLKSLTFSGSSAVLKSCSASVTANLKDLQRTLHRLRHRKDAPKIISSSPPLKDAIGSAVASADACRGAIGDVDATFVDVLVRKLNDLSLILDDVQYRVSQLSPNMINDTATIPTNHRPKDF